MPNSRNSPSVSTLKRLPPVEVSAPDQLRTQRKHQNTETVNSTNEGNF